eukprot:TRINITY_DN36316_c0_g1_i1.p1 TRINITY_DN36316_c0_g1~~TRINITY_DN36316_c0_g1_i1.p1  ORF type:complete len:574 (-),score=99.91 TRINITY_DN36316_c0_g1_i1:286-2007(-)
MSLAARLILADRTVVPLASDGHDHRCDVIRLPKVHSLSRRTFDNESNVHGLRAASKIAGLCGSALTLVELQRRRRKWLLRVGRYIALPAACAVEKASAFTQDRQHAEEDEVECKADVHDAPQEIRSTDLDVTLCINEKDDKAFFTALEQLPDAARGEVLLKWARLGREVLQFARVSPGQEAVTHYLAAFRQQKDELTKALEEHRSMFSRRSVGTEGSLAEDFVVHKLAEVFGPDGDRFRKWSDVGHRADAIGEIGCGDKPGRQVLIEVKQYTGKVQKPELDKFRRDMKENHEFQAGMFVSLSSPISGKRACEVDIEDGRPVVYLSQQSAGQCLFVVAWALLRELLGRGKTVPAGQKRLKDLARRTAGRLLCEVDAFKTDIMADLKRIAEIRRHVVTVQKGATAILEEAVRLETEISARARQLGRFIAREESALESDGEPEPGPPVASEAELLEGFEAMGIKWTNNEANMQMLLNLLNAIDNVTLEWTPEALNVLVEDVVRVRISKATKASFRLTFPEDIVTAAGLGADWIEDNAGALVVSRRSRHSSLPIELLTKAFLADIPGARQAGGDDEG